MGENGMDRLATADGATTAQRGGSGPDILLCIEQSHCCEYSRLRDPEKSPIAGIVRHSKNPTPFCGPSVDLFHPRRRERRAKPPIHVGIILRSPARLALPPAIAATVASESCSTDPT